MDQKLAVPQKRDCWICFNTENNITLTTVNFKKLVKNCALYSDFSIITKSFENQTSVSCCSYCYESAQKLTLVKEQIEKLQKEVSNLSLSFAQNILERRSRVKIRKDQSAKTSRSPTDISFAIHKNLDPHSIIVIDVNQSVKKEFTESWSKELPSQSQENSEIVDFITDPLLNADELEHFVEEKCDIDVQSADDIDPYDESVSRVFDTSKKTIVPNRFSATNEHGDQQTVKTSVAADVLKCLNSSINELENGRSPKTIANVGEETTKCGKDLDENEPCKCSTCGQGVLDLEDHDKLHNKKRLYVCSFCDKSFLKPSSLKVHENIHSEERPRPYKCSLCGKSYLQSSHLKSHETTHFEEKTYECSFCSKSFKKARHLKEHEGIHSGEKPYKCFVCSKSFRLQRILKLHEIIHSGEKPYKCPFCEKCFSDPSTRKKHERFHTGERPCKCSFCSKSFSTLSILRDPENIHSGKKPHKCSFCSKSFTSSSLLSKHKRVHTGEKLYKCPNCEESFRQEDLLTSHLQLKHGHKHIKEEFILP